VKKPLRVTGIVVGAFVLLLIIVGVATGGGKAAPTGNASPAATATPTRTTSPARTPAAIVTKAKTQPTRTRTAAATTQAAVPSPPPPQTTAPAAAPAPQPTAPAAAPAPPAPTTPAGCHPLTNGGNCYEPGEYCRNSDHGISGVAGDGEAITCKDNNGWRWEPS
jgi:hypothetical protein